MREAVYESDRTFQLWLYTVSHGQMLLRSTKTETHRTRIDLLFKNVHAINIIPLLRGLRVAPLDADGGMPRDQNRYEIASAEFRGHVIAGNFSHREDEGEYFDPSPFGEILLMGGGA